MYFNTILKVYDKKSKLLLLLRFIVRKKAFTHITPQLSNKLKLNLW